MPKLNIKNMVCPRCISAVQDTLKSLEINFEKVELGEVFLKEEINPSKLIPLKAKLENLGFDIIDNSKSIIVSKIKKIIIEQIHNSDQVLNINFSYYLSEKLALESTYLSHVFSDVEGKTIEKFLISQKIEKIKELIFNNELSLSEIAQKLNYSSVAYLSTQFKKETGLTPTEFKKADKFNRSDIASL